MARIQKKKPTFKKKKKQEDIPEAQPVTDRSKVADAKAYATDIKESATDTDKENKKKKLLSVSQASGADQTAVIRLVDKYFGTWIQFFREVKVELSKVTWPSRKQTIGSTAVVIVFVFMLAMFLGAADLLLSNIIRFIL